jgi:acetate kinase
MKVLVLNAGSTSLKYDLYEMDTEASLARGVVERIGGAAAHVAGGTSVAIDAPDVAAALSGVLAYLRRDDGPLASTPRSRR